mmetsp:Transcript_19016/g.48550  ORF Transcript_19016/g.48550 Transcript_19016/m.48550 type:complete len:392 (-) Transcript_19016:2627-3802(-)
MKSNFRILARQNDSGGETPASPHGVARTARVEPSIAARPQPQRSATAPSHSARSSFSRTRSARAETPQNIPTIARRENKEGATKVFLATSREGRGETKARTGKKRITLIEGEKLNKDALQSLIDVVSEAKQKPKVESVCCFACKWEEVGRKEKGLFSTLADYQDDAGNSKEKLVAIVDDGCISFILEGVFMRKGLDLLRDGAKPLPHGLDSHEQWHWLRGLRLLSALFLLCNTIVFVFTTVPPQSSISEAPRHLGYRVADAKTFFRTFFWSVGQKVLQKQPPIPNFKVALSPSGGQPYTSVYSGNEEKDESENRAKMDFLKAMREKVVARARGENVDDTITTAYPKHEVTKEMADVSTDDSGSIEEKLEVLGKLWASIAHFDDIPFKGTKS